MRHLSFLIESTLLILLSIFLIATSSQAQPTTSTVDRTDQAREQLLTAYQRVDSYQAKLEITISQKAGRLRQIMVYQVAYDRKANKLLVDRPDTMLVSNGVKLYFKADQVPGRHLEIPAPTRLDYQAIQSLGPVLGGLDLPDLVLLLATDPWSVLGEGSPATFTLDATPLTPANPITSGAPSNPESSATADSHTADKILRMTLSDGRSWAFHISPSHGLLTQAQLSIDGNAAGQPGMGTIEITFAFDINKINQPIDDQQFAFSTQQSQPATSLQAMVQGGGGGSGGNGAHPSVNQPAPPVSLATMDGQPFELAKEPARVVILDFWASWCGPCRVGLPLLQELAAWAETDKKSVRIYAVNLMEKDATIKAFVEQTKLTLPVLADVDGKVGRAYGVGAIPHTTVIVDGQVTAVHIGVPPDDQARKQYLEKMKKEIESALSSPPPATVPAAGSAKP